MAASVKWCAFGLLVLTSLAVSLAGSPRPTGTKCVFVSLKSTRDKPDKEQIKDENGRRADITSVDIIKTLSSVRCQVDDNIIISEPFVIATQGCKADLKVCYRTYSDPDPTVSAGCKVIRLLSRLNREDQETLDDRITSMKVVRRFSDNVKCESKQNFGFRGKVAFAKSGCRADFEVCFSGGTSPTDELTCEKIVLESTVRSPDKRRIRDNKGGPVEIVSLELTKQLSERVKCVEWKTFQFNETFVIARSGCWGRFTVCYKKPDTDPETPSGCITVRLLSTLNSSARKKVTDDGDNIKSVRVSKQFSGIKCIRNTNFGIKGNDVYTSGGCRADLLVCLSDLVAATDSPKSTCINVVLASKGSKDHDWKKITGRGGASITIKSIRLLRQESNEACIEWKTYYRSGTDEIHALNGCKGTFRVCYV